MTAYDYVKILSVDIGPRPPGSEANKQAAEFLLQELQMIGVHVARIEEFRLHPGYWSGSALFALVMSILISLFYWILPVLAFILSILLPVFTMLDIDGGHETALKLLPSAIGRNVIGIVKPRREAMAQVIICAHHDSKTQAIPVHYRGIVVAGLLLGMFYLILASMVESVRVLIIPQFEYARLPLGYGLFIVIIYFTLYLFMNLASRFVAQSPGAEDNGSAVGITLELAKNLVKNKPNRIEVWLLFTDGEEIGMRGAIEFAKKHVEELGNAYVINIEGCGINAPLAYSTREKSIRTLSCSSEMISILEKGAMESNQPINEIREADSTDAYFFLKQGYLSSTLWRYSDETRDVTHTVHDSINRIHPEKLEETVQFLSQVLVLIDQL